MLYLPHGASCDLYSQIHTWDSAVAAGIAAEDSSKLLSSEDDRTVELDEAELSGWRRW
jgi:hypothetical protein